MKRLVIAILCGLVVLSLATAASGAIRITKIYYDSPGSDYGSNASLNHEWIRIKNTGNRAKWLTGWRIKDADNHTYRFGTFQLRAGRAVKVHTGNGSDGRRHVYWDFGGYVWNNDGDTARLKKPSGKNVDRCSYAGTESAITC